MLTHLSRAGYCIVALLAIAAAVAAYTGYALVNSAVEPKKPHAAPAR